MKKSKIIISILSLGILGISTVQAGTASSGYNTTVGKLNGKGYTGYQTKSISGANGHLKSKKVGGDYFVDARMINSNGTAGGWRRNITDWY